VYHFDNSKDLCTAILYGRLGKFGLLLTDSNMLADAISCYFTLPRFFCIRFQGASKSESVTIAGAMPVEPWTVAFSH